MNNNYKHTQMGYAVVVGLGVCLLLLLFAIISTIVFAQVFLFFNWAFAVSIAILFVSIILVIFLILSFFSLTVELDKQNIKIKFGIGVIKRKFSLQDIKSFKIVKNQWYYGWGIRWWYKKGWIYNVSGSNAVELEMKDGKIYRIGTDDPKGFFAAISSHLSKQNINKKYV